MVLCVGAVIVGPGPIRGTPGSAELRIAVGRDLVDRDKSLVGLVRLLGPRLRQAQHGRGTGAETVRWLTARIFTAYDCNRIEATTRPDNLAIRRAHLSYGYV